MKKILLFFALTIPLLTNGQIKNKKLFYANLTGEQTLEGRLFIYQLKDSTIQFVPYQHIRQFYKKTQNELDTTFQAIENGQIEVGLQEYSITMIDKIKIIQRKQKMKNVFIGMGVGCLTGVLAAANLKNPDSLEFPVLHVFTQMFLIAGGTGMGAAVGAILPTAKARININGNKKNYQAQKAELGKYAILK